MSVEKTISVLSLLLTLWVAPDLEIWLFKSGLLEWLFPSGKFCSGRSLSQFKLLYVIQIVSESRRPNMHYMISYMITNSSNEVVFRSIFIRIISPIHWRYFYEDLLEMSREWRIAERRPSIIQSEVRARFVFKVYKYSRAFGQYFRCIPENINVKTCQNPCWIYLFSPHKHYSGIET